MKVDISSTQREDLITIRSEELEDFTDEEQAVIEEKILQIYGEDICQYKISQLDGNDSFSSDSDQPEAKRQKYNETSQGFEDLSKQEQSFFRGHEQEYQQNLLLHRETSQAAKISSQNEVKDSSRIHKETNE